jgi:WD40 repeat protein
VATLSSDGRARLWDSNLEDQLRPFASLRSGVRGVAIDETARRVLAWGDDGATVWPAFDSSKPVLDVGTPVDLAAFAPDGRAILTIEGRVATVRRLSDAGVASEIRVHGPIAAASVGERGRIAVATRTHVVVGGVSGGRRDLVHHARVTSLAFSPDGTRLATGTGDGTIYIWTLKTRSRHVLRGHTGAVVSVRFSADGRSLVSASADTTARLWNVADGSSDGVLRGHTKPLTSARFSPDGRYVVTAAEDADARMWSVATRRTVHVLRGAFHTVSDASFSDDGRWVLGAGPRTALLWNARTGERFDYLRGPTGPVTGAVWIPRSHVVVVASLDGTVRKYTCSVCATMAQLERLGHRRLATAR